mmetsp:Transcript_11345/g.29492  ORF Transcript_11345/g.29492 Transcript_11345/m.29492 type:complete len:170 (+) Transcript_11345:144-653(+)
MHHARQSKERFQKLTVSLPPPSRRDRVIEVGHIATPPQARIAKLNTAGGMAQRSGAPVRGGGELKTSPPLPKSAGIRDRRRMFAGVVGRPPRGRAKATVGAPSSILGLLKALSITAGPQRASDKRHPSNGQISSESEASPLQSQLGSIRPGGAAAHPSLATATAATRRA